MTPEDDDPPEDDPPDEEDGAVDGLSPPHAETSSVTTAPKVTVQI
jgi:hypothetical protein